MPNLLLYGHFINNAAVAARYLQSQFDINRVAIIDFDVHHGNGTQDIFYENENVLFISTHQYPYYPGTGSEQEKGKFDIAGFAVGLVDEKKILLKKNIKKNDLILAIPSNGVHSNLPFS